MAILLKLIYKFNVSSIKCPTAFLEERDIVTLKYDIKYENARE